MKNRKKITSHDYRIFFSSFFFSSWISNNLNPNNSSRQQAPTNNNSIVRCILMLAELFFFSSIQMKFVQSCFFVDLRKKERTNEQNWDAVQKKSTHKTMKTLPFVLCVRTKIACLANIVFGVFRRKPKNNVEQQRPVAFCREKKWSKRIIQFGLRQIHIYSDPAHFGKSIDVEFAVRSILRAQYLYGMFLFFSLSVSFSPSRRRKLDDKTMWCVYTFLAH